MSHDEQYTRAQKVGALTLGFIIMCFAVWLYIWLEKQRSGAANTLSEILSTYQKVSSRSRLVQGDIPFAYVQGRAESADYLVDELFKIQLQGIFYKRTIQRLKKAVTERPEGGRNLVSYNWAEWGESPFTSLRLIPKSLHVSGLSISSELLHWPAEGEAIRCDDNRIGAVPIFKDKALICRTDGEFSNRGEGEQFQEGDIRISFTYLPLGDISIIGKHSQGILYPVEDQNDTYLYLFEAGDRSPDELVNTARGRINKSGNTGNWICLAIFLLGLFFFTAPFRIRK